MNLFTRELKKNSKSFIIWIVIIIVINACLLAAFGSVAEMAKNNQTLLSQYPEEFIKAMSLDKLQMTDILHYFASRSYLLITIFGSIYAVMLSSSILSKEESEKTIEFLISKPITRQSIVSSKLACVTFYVTLFNVIFSISNLFLLNIFKTNDFSFKGFLLISIGAWLIHLSFAMIGLALSVFVTKTRTILSISMGIVFISYFFSLLVSLKENLSSFKYLTPFSYYKAEDLVISMNIQSIYLLLTLIIFTVSIGCTYYFYSKKDIAV